VLYPRRLYSSNTGLLGRVRSFADHPQGLNLWNLFQVVLTVTCTNTSNWKDAYSNPNYSSGIYGEQAALAISLTRIP
jgi:hypothetical protein